MAIERLFATFLPDTAQPTVFGGNKTGRKNCHVLLEYIFDHQDGYLWVVLPTINGDANHAFCAVDNLIFDNASPRALVCSKETANFLYGGVVNHIHARHYMYPIKKKRRGKKRAKLVSNALETEDFGLL